MKNFTFIGVDIAKDKFDVSLSSKHKTKTFPNTLAGCKKFYSWCQRHESPWIGMEATGKYNVLLADFLYKQDDVSVSVINPLQIKYFAMSRLRRNKTDSLDARIIAQFTQASRPRLYHAPSETQVALREQMTCVNQLKKQIVQLKNQRHSTQDNMALKAINASLNCLNKQLKKLELSVKGMIEKNETFSKQADLLRSIHGFGDLSVYRLLAFLPDLQYFQHAKQFAAFIGITPKQNESGLKHGKTRISKIGHVALRNTLYMPALSAKKHVNGLKCFAERLEKNGLAKKAIVIAVMRKLAHIIFGVLKTQQPYNPLLACAK